LACGARCPSHAGRDWLAHRRTRPLGGRAEDRRVALSGQGRRRAADPPHAAGPSHYRPRPRVAPPGRLRPRLLARRRALRPRRPPRGLCRPFRTTRKQASTRVPRRLADRLRHPLARRYAGSLRGDAWISFAGCESAGFDDGSPGRGVCSPVPPRRSKGLRAARPETVGLQRPHSRPGPAPGPGRRRTATGRCRSKRRSTTPLPSHPR
jgi:hypothetical protein